MNNENKSKRYYWIKLKDSFFTSDTVDFLMSQKNGANYIVLYQMLCLKAINTNGVLARQLGEIMMPFDAEKIQRDCKYFDIDTIRIALELYKKLGLIAVQENGVIHINNFDNMIGSETQGAIEKREQRALKQQQLLGIDKGIDKGIDNVYQDIDNKRLDIRDKDIDNKNKNKYSADVQDIFSYWNSFKIIVHREITDKINKAILKALKTYSVNEIKTYIERYNTILKDKDYYFNTPWALSDFLTQKNAMADFTDEGSKWNSYISRSNKVQPAPKKVVSSWGGDEF